MPAQPRIADTRPKPVELKAGETVYWCSCGRSQNQPFCDGSHAGTGLEPMAFTADRDDKYFFCLCKRTRRPPLCDGAHKAIGAADLEAQEGLRTVWYKVAERDVLRDGEVRAVQAGAQALALTRFQGRYGALDNACPHQGGPLGEGSIECGDAGDCWLRCPWHGWDFHPLTGRSPGGHDDGVPTYPVEERDDGVYVAVKESTARTRTVSDLIAETLVNWGISHVFGMVGHSNLGLADALRVQAEAGRLAYIGIRHEGAAAFAASAYAKLTGRPAACLSIAGPGATNLLTGLWDAKVDRAPVLALTGQVDTQVLGPGAFQEIDLGAAFAAVACFSQTVLPDSKHAELANLACKHALVRRDVAHLIFPDGVQTLPAAEGAPAGGPEGRLGDPRVLPAAASLEQARARLNAARRPAIIVGYGARDAMPEVLDLAETLRAPVLTTFKAKGQIADDHPLAAGVLGRSGTPVASWCMNEADLLLVFGASFANHTGISPKTPTIQVDFDPLALGKFHPVELPLLGEIGLTAAWLSAHLPDAPAALDQRADLAERWRIWRAEKAARRARDRGQGLNAASVFDSLSRLCPADAVLAVDVGNNTYSFGRYFECRQQRVLMSGYLGSIGFGFPAAMGAWAATRADPRYRGRKVLAVAGDGGFGQYLAEFTTAVKYGMDITLVLLNNNELAKISKEQRAGHWPVWQTGLVNPDFAAYAQSCGGYGARVARADQLDQALAAAVAHPGPALVELAMDPELI
ncbi:MAG: putative thiamine pyrophosphate-containing protein YdaP [Pseudomonadota bacterium]|jgi:thiamine pyrophosphate-dependent acetolactate synthase large subunit-like protein/nitrite reductase/ring-hydroxylating ferredoxin subunit/CDGSH-type Zn-finger protein